MNPELLEKLAAAAHQAFLNYEQQRQIPIEPTLNVPYERLGENIKDYYRALAGEVAGVLEKEKEVVAAFGGSAWGG